MENIDIVSDAVNSINGDLYEENKEMQELIEDGFGEVTVSSNGNVILVEFLGTMIWNSEDDERAYDAEEDTYTETVEDFLRKQIIEIVRVLSTVRL